MEENPESLNEDKSQEAEQDKDDGQTQQDQKESDEKELEVLLQPDSLDNIASVHSQSVIRLDLKKRPSRPWLL